MSCVNKSDPRYIELLSKYKNPLIAEVEYKSLFPEIKYQNISTEGKIASEKTIRDLAARMSDRIGMSIKIESDRTKEYKGKIENNVAYVNLAYATLDTPIHEILGHPIIRAIKNKDFTIPSYVYVENSRNTLIKDSKDIFTVKGAKNSEEFGTKSFNTKEEEEDKGLNNFDYSKNDTIKYINKVEAYWNPSYSYAVKNPEQIHILGSNQDIKKFKEYMEMKNNLKNYFNLTEEDSNFVQDISNLNFTC